MRSQLDPRMHEQRLADEAARWRKSLREEQARHDATRSVLLQANRQLLGVYLRERFRDPGDFDLLVGIDLVVDERGAIVWRRVVAFVDELLAAKPHLAATPDGLPVRGGVSAVEFFTNQPV